MALVGLKVHKPQSESTQNLHSTPKSQTLTKNGRLCCDCKPACHRLKLPSPSAMPNLLPCWANRQRVTLANVPGGRGVQTTCWWPHSHICTEPSWPPVRYSGISGWAHMRLMLSTLCFNTCTCWMRISIHSFELYADD